MKKNKLVRHTAIYALARGIPGVINLLAIIVYTRLLSPVEYGQYILVIAGVGLVNVTFFEWLRLSVLRFYSSYRNQPEVLFSTIIRIFLYLILLTGIIVLLVTFIFFSTYGGTKLIFVGLLLTWAQAWNELNLVLAQSSLNPINYGLISVSKAIISIGLGVFLIKFGFGVSGVLVGLIIGLVVPTLFLSGKLWQGTRFFFLTDKAIVIRFFKYGVPLGTTRIVTLVVDNSDRYIIAILLGTGAAGLYAAGYNLAQQILGVLMSIIVTAGYPLIIRNLEENGIKEARAQIRQYATLLLSIAIPAATGLLVLSPGVTQLFLGDAFREAATDIIPLISIAILVGGIKSNYYDLSFQLGHHTISQIWISFMMAIISVVLNVWWIPIYGIIGAAYSTVAAFSIGLVLSIVMGRRVFFLPALLSIDTLKIIISSLLMAAALWPIHLLTGTGIVIVQVLIGCVVYGIAILAFNVSNVRNRVLVYFAIKE